MEKPIDNVVLYTDGACSGNPGPGGWGAILVCGNAKKELSGGEPNTTNNRMELMAVISGLEALKRPCIVKIVSDSSYVVNTFEKGWILGWQKKNWMREGKPIPNTDLWKRLLAALSQHTVTWEWVRGHNGHPYNERCDRLAVAAYSGTPNK